MNAYEIQRQEKIQKNKLLLEELGIVHDKLVRKAGKTELRRDERPSVRRRRPKPPAPTRTSSRIASIGPRFSYSEVDLERLDAQAKLVGRPRTTSAKSTRPLKPRESQPKNIYPDTQLSADVDSLRKSWEAWEPWASTPTRDHITAAFHFVDSPTFTPNKSPEEMLREGIFGGSYFRPLRSMRLGGLLIQDDWKELPESWIAGLDIERQVAAPEYDPSINKFGVACGQSIEEWEAAGWINHHHDVRGWFQWYCRFFMGRRCDDDERQIGRWRRCVGETGRWRRMLLKRYRAAGVREVWDDGEDDDMASHDVSPVMHQTCLHWAFEIRQDVLDAYWRENP